MTYVNAASQAQLHTFLQVSAGELRPVQTDKNCSVWNLRQLKATSP